jgi:short subunit dehydrogenase-like uncharacterized protein
MVGKLGEGGSARKDGKIIRVPLGQKAFQVDFGKKKLFVMNIPWGDVSTAYFTTGIPDIESYAGVSPWVHKLLKLQPLFNWLLRTAFVRNVIKRKVDQRAAGPSDEMRSKAESLVWGQVADQQGMTATARLSGPDGYTFTAYSALLTIQKILMGKFAAGYQTPASAYGEDLVLEIPGVKREVV